MPRFMVAHVRRQNVDLILVPLEGDFERYPREEQAALVAELRERSLQAGLMGTVVPVWQGANEHMKFVAPRNLHPIFQGIDVSWVLASVNRELSWM
jgi:hypothetical protein